MAEFDYVQHTIDKVNWSISEAKKLANYRPCTRKVQDLTGPELDPYIAKAMGHLGTSDIAFHTSGEIAMQLFTLHGTEIKRFADGFYATMKHGSGLFTMNAKDPVTAIYRAYVASKLGDEV